ncbi:uncharacterized protein LOC127854005 isoform X2 [Dreissena polymorpha]|uniref:uncharacterized protein LOC127854005 isoform X2 n=1 Tax=Dreissena polymorpha TaxID=45954 RepID=UPI002265683C|nr:uncharacterized protein LOC127854005 isoform X2 [Dreissena polymorpha]
MRWPDANMLTTIFHDPAHLLQTTIAFILFTTEWYHIWGHTLILFRIRMLPRKDLVRIRLYFLFDLLSVFCSSFLFTGKLRWLAVIHAAQHAYYYIFWEKTGFAKKIINWSSLDYLKTNLRNRWELDSIFGTAFDIMVHICMTYYLGQYLNVVQVTCSLTIVQVGIMLLLFGPYFAWANPSNIPAWVQKRLAPDKLKDPDVVPSWIFGRAGDSGNENKS